MLEKVYFETEDNIKLFGLLSKPNNNTKKIVISVHGMQSNCFKKREDILGTKINEAGIAYFAFNNRGAELVTYTQNTNGQKFLNGGAVFENVLDSYYDIKAAINEMLKYGYEEIYLQGHSLGCTKIVYTYNKLKNENDKILHNICGIILLSLIDIPGAQKFDLGIRYDEILDYANNKEKEGKSEDLMPEGSFEHPISVKTYLRYFKYNKDIDFARYWDNNYNYKELNNIEVPLFLRWGNVHELVVQNLDDLVKTLSTKIKNKQLNIGYINGADHGYSGKETELAKQIIKFIKGE